MNLLHIRLAAVVIGGFVCLMRMYYTKVNLNWLVYASCVVCVFEIGGKRR